MGGGYIVLTQDDTVRREMGAQYHIAVRTKSREEEKSSNIPCLSKQQHTGRFFSSWMTTKGRTGTGDMPVQVGSLVLTAVE